jgi:tRNA nucleotidyltransferase (CCA-adding enzyme)
MEVYEVGGAVRDALLGEPVNDRDWVVVGATPQAMIDAGYRPVGRDFPVFLHPTTHEEYALARTERKQAPGYHGFSFHAAPDVTLEEDLARRDLTINAMARGADGRLVDPFGGRRDLADGVLRHVSPAFAQDPVRLLRLARFAARWPTFRVADETQALLARLVETGEVDALVAERVWQELARGLMEVRPSRMLEVLHGCGALGRLLPTVDTLWGTPTPQGGAAGLLLALDHAARLSAPLAVRFALLALDPSAPVPTAPETAEARALAIAQRWKVPIDCRELATLVARERSAVAAAPHHDAEGLARLLDRCDVWRRPLRFEQALLAWTCATASARADASLAGRDDAVVRIRNAWQLARAVDVRAVSAQALDQGQVGAQIAQALFAARRQAIHTGLAPA